MCLPVRSPLRGSYLVYSVYLVAALLVARGATPARAASLTRADVHRPRPGLPNQQHDRRIVFQLRRDGHEVQLSQGAMRHIVHGDWELNKCNLWVLAKGRGEVRLLPRRTVMLRGGGHTFEGLGVELDAAMAKKLGFALQGFMHQRLNDGAPIAKPMDFVFDSERLRDLLFTRVRVRERLVSSTATFHLAELKSGLGVVTLPSDALTSSEIARVQHAAAERASLEPGVVRPSYYRKSLYPRGLGLPEHRDELEALIRQTVVEGTWHQIDQTTGAYDLEGLSWRNDFGDTFSFPHRVIVDTSAEIHRIKTATPNIDTTEDAAYLYGDPLWSFYGVARMYYILAGLPRLKGYLYPKIPLNRSTSEVWQAELKRNALMLLDRIDPLSSDHAFDRFDERERRPLQALVTRHGGPHGLHEWSQIAGAIRSVFEQHYKTSKHIDQRRRELINDHRRLMIYISRAIDPGQAGSSL